MWTRNCEPRGWQHYMRRGMKTPCHLPGKEPCHTVTFEAGTVSLVFLLEGGSTLEIWAFLRSRL